jgi:hypothetical protein
LQLELLREGSLIQAFIFCAWEMFNYRVAVLSICQITSGTL